MNGTAPESSKANMTDHLSNRSTFTIPESSKANIHHSCEVQVTAWSSKANMTRDHLQEMQRRPLSPRCKNLINMVMIFFHWDHHKDCIIWMILMVNIFLNVPNMMMVDRANATDVCHPADSTGHCFLTRHRYASKFLGPTSPMCDVAGRLTVGFQKLWWLCVAAVEVKLWKCFNILIPLI